jgi:hypothetical protein
MDEMKKGKKIMDFVNTGHQADATGIGAVAEQKELSAEEERQMTEVRAFIQTDMWKLINTIMSLNADTATNALESLRSTNEELRYFQGYLQGVLQVRQNFLNLAKEETYVGLSANTQEPE